MSRRLVDLVGVAPIPPKAPATAVFGGATLAKAAVRFTELAGNGKTCSTCTNAHKSGTLCRIVAGPITLTSGCALWARSAEVDWRAQQPQ